MVERVEDGGPALLPIYLPGGLGDRLYQAMKAYLDDYAFDPNPDDGCADHEPTEFERAMLEDFLMGVTGDEAVTSILQEVARAARSPSEPLNARTQVGGGR